MAWVQSDHRPQDYSPPHPGAPLPGSQPQERVPEAVVFGVFSSRCWNLFGLGLAAVFTLAVIISVVVVAFAKDDAYKPEFSEFVRVKDGKVRLLQSFSHVRRFGLVKRQSHGVFGVGMCIEAVPSLCNILRTSQKKAIHWQVDVGAKIS